MVLQVGAEFAGYVIEGVVGAGGMGVVYRARHPRLNRMVALKALNDAFALTPRSRTAFAREAALSAELEHPNIVSVLDWSGDADDVLWLAMRLIEGGDVAALLTSTPRGLPVDQAVRLITDAAHALDFAHERGVLHRDVKPANLLIEHDPRHGERALLTDFGIARTLDDTATFSVTATFAYTAPERFGNQIPTDHRADVYSLGCTFYEMLTGKLPFVRSDQAALIGAHLADQPPRPLDLRPDLPAGLDAVI
ncbi:serine/threonine-protein kinase, partial [Nocardia sp. NPDC004722]